jgi:hypothetical protein
MKRLLSGMVIVGWLGCSVAEPPESVPASKIEASQPDQSTASTPSEAAQPGEAAQPSFNACLAGQTCAVVNGCNGISNNVPCGVGRTCCTPSADPRCGNGEGRCVEGTHCPGNANNIGVCSTTAVCCPLLD